MAVMRDARGALAIGRHSREGGNPWTFHVFRGAFSSLHAERKQRPWIPAFAGMTSDTSGLRQAS